MIFTHNIYAFRVFLWTLHKLCDNLSKRRSIMQFSEQLRSLRISSKMTQKDLADKLCISPSTIGMYEQNRRIPDVETLNKISSIFGVSVDYLLGNSTHNETPGATSIGNYIRRLRTSHNLSQEDFGELFGISKTMVSLYENGISIPNEHIKNLICNYFGVNMDRLYNHYPEKQSVDNQLNGLTPPITEREQDLLKAFRKLNNDNQDIIVGEVKKYLKEQK